MVQIAALGKPIEVHDKDEMGGLNPAAPTREVAMGDQQQGGEQNKAPAPPTLRLPGEAAPTGGPGKVQFPTDPAAPIPPPPTTSSSGSAPKLF